MDRASIFEQCLPSIDHAVRRTPGTENLLELGSPASSVSCPRTTRQARSRASRRRHQPLDVPDTGASAAACWRRGNCHRRTRCEKAGILVHLLANATAAAPGRRICLRATTSKCRALRAKGHLAKGLSAIILAAERLNPDAGEFVRFPLSLAAKFLRDQLEEQLRGCGQHAGSDPGIGCD